MNSVYSYAMALLIGASGAWFVQGLRWDNDVAAMRHDSDTTISANVDAVNRQLIASRAQTEGIRTTFIEYKTGKENETNALERAVADGSKRLSIRATCTTAVRPTGAIPSGTGSGTAELTADASAAYWDLRRGLDRQYGLLQFCRSELRARSSRAK